jgi:Putative DNA-binding domain
MEINRPSRAKAYFDQVKLPENGARFLNALVGSETPTFESEFLEFKGAHNLDPAGRDLLELWAKNLSGFANSDGGVVIFGIDAPKGAAKSLSLVQDLAALSSKLKNTLPKITEPPVQRVEIEAYRNPPDANKGFVVCYIPASPWRPHQVRTDGQPGQFYIRASDNCVPCNHATLRALFAPQLVSTIEIHYKTMQQSDVGSQGRNVVVQCWLLNKGPASAKEPFVLVNIRHTSTSFEYNHMLWEETQIGSPGKALLCRRSVHPEERIHILSVPLGVIFQNGTRHFTSDSYTFQFSVSAHNQAPTDFAFTVQVEDAKDGLTGQATLVSRDNG